MRWLLASMLAACWSSTPPPAGPPTARIVDHPPATSSRAALVTPAKKRERLPPDHELAARLRSGGGSALSSLVTGPLVFVDLDFSTVVTLCGRDAINLAGQWGDWLADPKREALGCVKGPQPERQACNQFGPYGATRFDGVLLELRSNRLLSIVAGDLKQFSSELEARLAKQLESATCP